MALRKELGLSHSVLVFKNLDDLLATLDEYVELHSNAVAKYDDRLGFLLRSSGAEGDQNLASAQSIERDDKKQKGDKRRDPEDRNWVTLGTDEYAIKIAANFTAVASNEISALFRVVELLKAKILMINSARKLLAELPSKGFRADQKIRVVFRDGVPRQVIPTNEMEDQQQKFHYSEQFQIMAQK